MTTSDLIVRITIGFISLFVLTRILGRKEIGQMTFFNFVSAIAIGSIASNLVINQNLTIGHGVLALIGWTAFTFLLDVIDIKWKPARKITTGDPVIVIKEGRIMEKALRKTRLDMDALKTMLRENNIFSLADVDYAIFEPSGKLSVLPKASMQPLTKSDMNVSNNKKRIYPIATEVVSDGKILSKNLAKLNLDETWIHQQLQQAGVESVEDVFFAEVQQDGSLYIDNRDDVVH